MLKKVVRDVFNWVSWSKDINTVRNIPFFGNFGESLEKNWDNCLIKVSANGKRRQATVCSTFLLVGKLDLILTSCADPGT